MDIANPVGMSNQEGNQTKLEKVAIDSVPGLTLIKNFISEAEESLLLAEVNKRPWSNTLKRRVQHYGYEYDYTSRNMAKRLGPLPDFLSFVIDRILEEYLVSERPDQCIINEYEAGQGISSHIDIVRLFGEEIVSVSMGSDIVMDFTSPEKNKVSVLLPRRSLFLMEGEVRHKWKHGISARKKDELENGTVLIRKKRVSLTFRYVVKSKLDVEKFIFS